MIFLPADGLRYASTCEKLQWLVGKAFNKNVNYIPKNKQNRGNVSFKQARETYWNDNSKQRKKKKQFLSKADEEKETHSITFHVVSLVSENYEIIRK